MRDDELQALITRRLPPELAAAPPEIRRYPDELVLLLTLADPASPEEAPAAIARAREQSRPLRMALAHELEAALGLPVAWGMRAGATELLFTTRSAPVMTRLGRSEREVLDTLVAAGVADTRSSALAYVVRAFAAEHGPWLAEAREALVAVEQVRARLRHRPRPGPPPAPE